MKTRAGPRGIQRAVESPSVRSEDGVEHMVRRFDSVALENVVAEFGASIRAIFLDQRLGFIAQLTVELMHEGDMHRFENDHADDDEANNESREVDERNSIGGTRSPARHPRPSDIRCHGSSRSDQVFRLR